MIRSETRQAGTLIVLAWGCPPRLDGMIGRLGPLPDRVVLIDPVPGSDLPAILRDHDGILRIAAVAGPGEAGQARLDRYSLPGLFALAPATDALARLFPGLERTGSLTADRIDPEALATRLADLSRPLHVVIDTPGAEHLAIDALEAAQLRDDIARISLRCGLEPFFEGAREVQALRGRLEPDFRLVEERGGDPDWPELVFEADAAARRIARLEAALARREAELTDLGARLEDTIATRTRERDEARTALETEAASLRDEIEARTKERDEAQAALDARTRERDEARAALEAEAASLRDEIDARTKERDEAQAALDARTRERDEARAALETEAASLRGEIDARTKERDEAQAALDARTRERDEARAALEAEAASLRDEIGERTRERDEARAAHKTDTARLHSEIDARARELHEARAALDARTRERDEARTALEAEAASLRDEIDARTRERDEAQAALDARTRERDEARTALAERTERLAQATSEAERLRSELAAMTESAAALERDAAQRKTETARATGERDRLQTDLGLALRMQGVLQSDLEDLRRAYRRSEEQRREHEALLRKLTPRLQEAAQQLRDLHLLQAEETGRAKAVTRTEAPDAPLPPRKDKRKSRAKGKKTDR